MDAVFSTKLAKSHNVFGHILLFTLSQSSMIIPEEYSFLAHHS